MNLDDSTLTMVKEMAKIYAREYLPNELPYFSLIWEQIHQQKKDAGDFTARDTLSSLRLPFAAGRKLQIVTPLMIMTLEATLLECDGLMSAPTENQTQEAIAKCAEVYGLSKRKAQQMGKRMAKSLNNLMTTTILSDGPLFMADDVLNPENKNIDYFVYLSDKSDLCSIRNPTSTADLKRKYISKKEEYDIFIQGHNVYIKQFKKKLKPLLFRKIYSYRILVMLLMYKDKYLPPVELYQNAWYQGEASERIIFDDGEINKNLKAPVSRLRTRISDILPSFDIPDKSGLPGYTCTGSFKYCVILSSETDEQMRISSCEPV